MIGACGRLRTGNRLQFFWATAARNFFQQTIIQVPVLFIVGECDGAGAKKAAIDLSALIPGSEISYIQNAGHFSCIEQPEEFNMILTGFLKKTQNSN